MAARGWHSGGLLHATGREGNSMLQDLHIEKHPINKVVVVVVVALMQHGDPGIAI